MTTGGQPDETAAHGAGRAVPDAENYLDLSGVEDDDHGPHFDVVLRGYDRRQVDDHVSGLRRMVAQLRAQLAVRERRRESSGGSGSSGDTGPSAPSAPAEAIPAARTPPGDEADDGDNLGAFNDRLRGILQAAEQEAQAVRSRAAETLLAEHAESRAALADLRSQRDAVVDELVRLRGWLDEIVSHPGRAPAAPPPVLHPGPPRVGPWSPPGPPPGRPPVGPPAGRYAPLRPGQLPGVVTGPGSGGFAAPPSGAGAEHRPGVDDEPDTVDGGAVGRDAEGGVEGGVDGGEVAGAEHEVRDPSETGSGTSGR